LLITHLGHACVLVEIDGLRALIDPGGYSTGFDDLLDLDLILITHEHEDHFAMDRLAIVLERNGGVTIISNAAVAAKLPEEANVLVIEPGETRNVRGLSIEATGAEHAVIHPLVPNVASTGFVLGGRIWHPGDSFAHDARQVDILLLPVGGPWMRLQEAIDFERSVSPRVAIPIHEAGLSHLHQALHYRLLTALAPAGTSFVPLERGTATNI
jgi:L-ascorbate metabolism protein UlaG (beta-lactamase superfamily)